MAVACHIRLHRYMSNQRQDDVIDKEFKEFGATAKLTELAKAVNKTCLIKCTATIHQLQYFMKQFFEIPFQTKRIFPFKWHCIITMIHPTME